MSKKFTNRNSLLDSGRLTGLRTTSNNRFSKNVNKFDYRQDARLKLVKKQPMKHDSTGFVTKNRINQHNHDARQMLIKKQQKKELSLSMMNEHDNRSLVEPVMIVTGLANVKKEGDKLTVVKKDHLVVVKGNSTLVTLTNTNTLNSNQKRLANDDDIIGLDNSLNRSPGFKPIRIQIENDLKIRPSLHSPSSSPSSSSMSFLKKHPALDSPVKPNRSSAMSISRTNSRYDEEMMDCDDNMSSRMSSRITKNGSGSSSKSSISLNNNGYKLTVSNLHPRVTEDDVLELFSDIGPIKRARFLDKGLAEVVYVKLEHAKEAIYKYDKNELDGRAMRIQLVDDDSSYERNNAIINNNSQMQQHFMSQIHQQKSMNINSFSSDSASRSGQFNMASNNSSRMSTTGSINFSSKSSKSTENSQSSKETLSNRFKSANEHKPNETTSFSLPESNSSSRKSDSNKVNVDNSIIHQVLFNKKASNNTNPVTFTVKL